MYLVYVTELSNKGMAYLDALNPDCEGTKEIIKGNK